MIDLGGQNTTTTFILYSADSCVCQLCKADSCTDRLSSSMTGSKLACERSWQGDVVWIILAGGRLTSFEVACLVACVCLWQYRHLAGGAVQRRQHRAGHGEVGWQRGREG